MQDDDTFVEYLISYHILHSIPYYFSSLKREFDDMIVLAISFILPSYFPALHAELIQLCKYYSFIVICF